MTCRLADQLFPQRADTRTADDVISNVKEKLAALQEGGGKPESI